MGRGGPYRYAARHAEPGAAGAGRGRPIGKNWSHHTHASVGAGARCWTRIVCPGRAGIRARFARIARGGHGHPFIERPLWDGGMVSKLSKRFDFKWSPKWVRVI
jgi:hypothetical protein